MLDRAYNSCWEREDGCDEIENAFDDNADQTEGKKHQPDERIKAQREQRCWPANNQEQTEEDELHGMRLLSLNITLLRLERFP